MDMLRGILIGLGCFGLLIVGSCTMLGYGTMAVLDKAAAVAKKEAATPEGQAKRDAAIDRAVDRFVERAEQSELDSQYGASSESDYSDFGEPTNDLENQN
jgi:hypothetical protein